MTFSRFILKLFLPCVTNWKIHTGFSQNEEFTVQLTEGQKIPRRRRAHSRYYSYYLKIARNAIEWILKMSLFIYYNLWPIHLESSNAQTVTCTLIFRKDSVKISFCFLHYCSQNPRKQQKGQITIQRNHRWRSRHTAVLQRNQSAMSKRKHNKR